MSGGSYAIFWLLIGLATWCHEVTAVDTCHQKSACSCLSENGLVNLLPLAKDGRPGLEYDDTDRNMEYFYNPCTNFDLGSVKDAGVVLYEKNLHNYFAIGDNNVMRFHTENGHFMLGSHGKDNMDSIITLKCDKSVAHDFKFVSTDPNDSDKYNFRLTSRYCCPGYKDPPAQRVSVGTFLIVIFVIMVAAYLLIGIAFQVAVKKARGREIFPNITFWTNLPGVIKDGCVFTFSCGKRRGYDHV